MKQRKGDGGRILYPGLIIRGGGEALLMMGSANSSPRQGFTRRTHGLVQILREVGGVHKSSFSVDNPVDHQRNPHSNACKKLV